LNLGKYSEAERIQREVLGALKRVLGTLKRVLGAEHPDTLRSASDLAMSLLNRGKYAEAERIQREVHGVEKRVLGAEHPDECEQCGWVPLEPRQIRRGRADAA
jgi:hypothetical protein